MLAIVSLPSSRRSCETYVWSTFAAVAGARPSQRSSISCVDVSGSLALTSSRASNARCFAALGVTTRSSTTTSNGPRRRNSMVATLSEHAAAPPTTALIPALYLASTDDAHPAPMDTGAPTLDRPSSPRGVRRRQVLRPRRMLIFACLAAEAWLVAGGGPADHT